MLIITCAGRNREAKVARNLLTKEFYITKNQYYYGLKLQALAFRRKGTIPFPESISLTSAEDNDLTVFKQNLTDTIFDRTIFGDKIYSLRNTKVKRRFIAVFFCIYTSVILLH